MAQPLRAAGVLKLAFGDVAVEFAPFVMGSAAADREVPIESSDPLHDAATYAGGKVPGYNLTDFTELADGETER